MKITILGNNSALPAFGRHPTAQAVSVYGDVLLLDCGEGTQIQMQRYGIKWRNLQHIFISHLHGDHYFGLPGLINSMSLLGRVAPMHLHGPAALMPILDAMLQVADTKLAYPLHFHPLPQGTATIVDTPAYNVTCFPVEHRITCHGFVVQQKNRGRRLLPVQCLEQGIPTSFFEQLKTGIDYTAPDGRVVKNEWVTEPGPPVKRYAYCADTLFTTSFLEAVAGVDLLYHECTYLEQDKDKAIARHHSTAAQAAELARLAGAGMLLLGHFSSKYKDLEPFQDEAAAVFQNSVVSVEGVMYEI